MLYLVAIAGAAGAVCVAVIWKALRVGCRVERRLDSDEIVRRLRRLYAEELPPAELERRAERLFKAAAPAAERGRYRDAAVRVRRPRRERDVSEILDRMEF